MKINIDENAGFCWGVVRTIDIAEKILNQNANKKVYILGQIIHNPKESERLESLGLKTISINEFKGIANTDSVVIIRAHGEPPSTYKEAKKYNIFLIDATCPLVRALQKRVKKYYDLGYQIIIHGKKEHAEVIGLRGFCNDECLVINTNDNYTKDIDFSKKTVLLSQTTMNKSTFDNIKSQIENKFISYNSDSNSKFEFIANDTICKYVAVREQSLVQFARDNDIIIFVAGRNSSNAKMLFQICSSVNHNSYFIEDYSEIQPDWFIGIVSIGITGATSTPQWFMEYIKSLLMERFNNKK